MNKTQLLAYALTALLVCTVTALGQNENSAVDGSFDSNGITLYYKTQGKTGEYVVVLAGGPGSTVDYMQPVGDALSGAFRVIMLEQRGTSRSKLEKLDAESVRMERYVEDIEALRKHLKVRRIHLVGNSWGMMLALLYAGQHPQNVGRIVTIGSGPITDKYAAIFDDNFRGRLTAEEHRMRRELRRKLASEPDSYVQINYEMDKIGLPAYYYDRDNALKAAAVLKPDDLNYRLVDQFFAVYNEFDLRPFLKKVTAPTLMIHGRQDLAGESNIIEAQGLVKGSKLVFIERCGHLPWEEKPKETLPLVLEFLTAKAKPGR